MKYEVTAHDPRQVWRKAREMRGKPCEHISGVAFSRNSDRSKKAMHIVKRTDTFCLDGRSNET